MRRAAEHSAAIGPIPVNCYRVCRSAAYRVSKTSLAKTQNFKVRIRLCILTDPKKATILWTVVDKKREEIGQGKFTGFTPDQMIVAVWKSKLLESNRTRASTAMINRHLSYNRIRLKQLIDSRCI